MAWIRRCCMLLGTAGCLPPTPTLDSDTEPADTTTGADPTTNTTVSTTSTTTPSTSTPATDTTVTEPPDTEADSDSTSSSSTESSSSTTMVEPPVDFGPCSPVVDPLIVDGDPDQLYTVSNDEIAVEFDPGTNYMASSLTHGAGAELLHTEDYPHERLTGIGYFVTPAIDEYSWRGATADLEVIEDGPAVVQLRVTWSTDDTTTEASLAGTTTYTIIPDGRMVREESFMFAHESTPESVYLTAYMALDAGSFDYLRSSFPLSGCDSETECEVGQVGVDNVAGYGTGIFEDDAWLCATDEDGTHSVSWMLDSESAFGPEFQAISARVTEVHGALPEHSLAMQYDWLRDGVASSTDAYRVHVLAYVNDDDSDCACSQLHFGGYGMHPSPNATEGGLGVDYRTQGAYFDVGVSDSPLVLVFDSEPLPPTMLLRLLGPTTITGVSLGEEELDEGVDYLMQTADDGESAWLYLARPLNLNDTLTITTDV